MPLQLSPTGFGIQVYLTRSTPSLLLQWLRDEGHQVKELRGYLLEGKQFCRYLESWLDIKQLDLEHRTVFEGVLGETNPGVFFQKPFTEVQLTFDEPCFDLVGQSIVNEVKALGIKF